MKKESAATKRARERGYFDRGPEWYCEFRYDDITGIGYEEGVNRRDPTSVILVDGTYYTWYAASKDGYNWEEQGPAVERSSRGHYDDRSVFTPEILHYEDKFYLVYQCVQHPYVVRVKNTIGMAVADSPRGPWRKLDEPILRPSDGGKWKGEDDNRFSVEKKGDFDSHKVHDPVLFYYKDKFYLYYKGERMGEEMFMGGRETKWGVAIADSPEGPYIKSEYNPVSNSGHETLLWQYKGGMVGLLSTDGCERNTVQYAKDGINFEIMACLKGAPEASGPFRDGDGEGPLGGVAWGLSHRIEKKWHYIERFRKDENVKTNYLQKTLESKL